MLPGHSEEAWRALEARNREFEQRLADLHHIERTLRDQHNRLQMAMNAGRIDTWVWDHRADVLTYPDVDIAISKKLPRSYAVFLSNLLPEDRAIVETAINKSFAENVPYNAEFRYPMVNGKIRWLYATGRVFYDDLGQAAGITGVTLDIHKIKTAEESMYGKEAAAHAFQERLINLHEVSVELAQVDSLDEFYRLSIDLGRNKLGFDRLGLFLISEDGNKAMGVYGTDIHGQTRGEQSTWFTMDKTWLMKEAVKNPWNIALRPETDIWDDMKVVGRGWNAMAMLWNEENPIGWLAADNLLQQEPLHDAQLELLSLYASMLGALILKKQAELQTRRHQERLSLALRASGMRVWEWKVGEDKIDYDEDTLFGNRPLITDWTMAKQIIEPEDYTLVVAERDRCIQADRPMYIEYRSRFSDGSQHWLASLGQPYHNEQGEVEGIIGVSQDITQRKQAEWQDIELASQKERVALLSEFMSNISHDLKTPLTVMNTSLYLLERIDEPGKRAEKIETIRSQAVLVENFIQDMLTMSRLDYSSTLDMKPVNCRAVLRDVEMRLRPAAEIKRLGFSFDFETDLLSVLGDENELYRMLVNLVENAIHYTPEGGSVTVRGSRDNDKVMVEVRDLGIGINEDDIPNIFSRFFRAEHAREIYSGGTGLGLAIAKRIVEIHNGQIEVESKSGQGSTFRLWLPVSATPESEVL